MTKLRCTVKIHWRIRRGATAVEFALISPLLFAFSFGAIEVGRAIMTIQLLEEATRVGCRMAILDDADQTDVENEVIDLLAAAGIGITATDVNFDPDPLTGACLWDPVTIAVSVPYSNVSWIPVPTFMGSVNLSGSSTLPREGNPCPE